MFLKRLFVGLIIGLIAGGVFAAAAVLGLHWDVWPNEIVAYLFAGGAGALTGLVAGKPIWAKGAMIEGWLKAFFGALLAAGGFFALSKWGPAAPFDIAQLHIAKAALAEQPATALPVVAAVLGAIFGLDDTPEAPGKEGKTRVASQVRVAGSASDDSDADEVAPAAKKRAR